MAEPGVKTFVQMQQIVSRRLLNIPIATATTFPTLTDIKDELNDQMRMFIAKRTWIWRKKSDTSVTLVTDQTDYSALNSASSIIRIRNLTTGKYYTFQRRALFEIENKKAASDFQGGEPQRWSYIDRDTDNSIKFRFNTKPPSANNGDVLDITHLVRHADLSDDAAISILPEEFNNIPIYRTIEMFFTTLDDHTNAAIWGNKALTLESQAWKQHMQQGDHVDTPNTSGLRVPSQWPFN